MNEFMRKNGWWFGPVALVAVLIIVGLLIAAS
jgi:hypothetical protein